MSCATARMRRRRRRSSTNPRFRHSAAARSSTARSIAISRSDSGTAPMPTGSSPCACRTSSVGTRASAYSCSLISLPNRHPISSAARASPESATPDSSGATRVLRQRKTRGLQLGIKLPPGRYGTAVKFSSGPNAGAPLDASLQAGTGRTDVILGAYYYRAVSEDFGAFADVQYQAAFAHQQSQPGNDFRPGNATTLSFGLRYEANPKWVPQMQLNLSRKEADQGALADVPDTAGTVAYLSPGMTIEVVAKLHLYGFVQLPVYSNLDGYQLFPHWTAAVGANYAL